MWTTQSVLFCYPGNRKRLTRKSGKQYVMVWNVLRGIRHNVANEMFFNAKVRLIGFFAPIIPLARKNTASTYCFKAQADATNPGEQINESEVGHM